jgi:3-carboxy-cis,cis-muconate cycloisomerase
VTSLWWPGDHRAGDLMSDETLLATLVRVEGAWSAVLVETGIAPAEVAVDLTSYVARLDLATIAEDAEAGGNPVIPLLAALRGLLPEPAATWLHRGLTSQDVVDSAIQLCVRDAVARVRTEIGTQVERLVALVRAHRDTPMTARTLTRPAVPTTFGAKAADWLAGLVDAAEDLDALAFPLQLGGAAGTLAGLVELGGEDRARAARATFAAALRLAPAAPWHTRRAPVTRTGDALVRLADAWGRIANDVLVLGRPEIGELADGSGGGSSTMPHKTNPTAAVLLRRHSIAAPGLAATLHAAAAAQVDERADGGWHAEWATLATLLRRTVVAASQASDLLGSIRVDPGRMSEWVAVFADDLSAEQRGLAAVVGREPRPTYVGLTDDLIDEVLARAAALGTEETDR